MIDCEKQAQSVDKSLHINTTAAAILNSNDSCMSSVSSSTDSGVVLDEVFQDTQHTNNLTNDSKTNNDKNPQAPMGPPKSPSLSINSTIISINSLDENDFDSSVLDSDSDFDNNDGIIVRKLGEHTHHNPTHADIMKSATPGMILSQIVENGLPQGGVLAHTTTQRAQIGNVAVENSSDVTFGDKNFFQGPVTIKQFVVESSLKFNQPIQRNGNVNNAYDVNTETDGANTHATNNSTEHSTRQNNDPAKDHSTRKLIFNKFILKRKAVITTVVISILTVIIFIAATIILKTYETSKIIKLGDGDDNRKNTPILTTIGEDNIGSGLVLRTVSRDEWVAQPPRTDLDKLKLPVHKVIIAHTATEGCTTQAECTFHVRYIQSFHMDSRNWDDIAYNFLIGGDGSIYEGRGWDNQGAHTKGFNVDSVCLAFIGTFIRNPPTDNQLKVAKLLIEEGIRLGKVSKDYKLFGQRQLNGSESPGKTLYDIITKWPHWSNKIL